MCMNCIEEGGLKKGHEIINLKTSLLAHVINLVYEYSCVGSNLHIFVDDCNTEDHFLDSCLEFIEENIHEASFEHRQLERDIIKLAKQCSELERLSALAIVNGSVEGGYYSTVMNIMKFDNWYEVPEIMNQGGTLIINLPGGDVKNINEVLEGQKKDGK